MTALMTLSSFDNIVYMVFKATLNKNHEELVNREDFMTLKIPKRSLVFGFWYNLFLICNAAAVTIFYTAWYKRIGCEKLGKLEEFENQQVAKDFWEGVFSADDNSMKGSKATAITTVFFLCVTIFGMPLIDCILPKPTEENDSNLKEGIPM